MALGQELNKLRSDKPNAGTEITITTVIVEETYVFRIMKHVVVRNTHETKIDWISEAPSIGRTQRNKTETKQA